MAWFGKARCLYRTMGFIRLYRTIGSIVMPAIVLYWVFAWGAPKMFLITIPIFVGFGWVSYETLKRAWNSK